MGEQPEERTGEFSIRVRLRRYALQLELVEPRVAGGDQYRKFALGAFYNSFPVDSEELQPALERLRETGKNYGNWNQRRGQLINKQFDEGLNQSEEAELKQLEERIDEYIGVVHSQPFGPLEVMEQKVRELSSETNQTGQQ